MTAHPVQPDLRDDASESEAWRRFQANIAPAKLYGQKRQAVEDATMRYAAAVNALAEARYRAALATPPSATEPAGLREALDAVESRHRQGDWTEEGWVGNSVDGLECSGCGEDWPCSATRLRLASPEPVEGPRPDLVTTIHEAAVRSHRTPPASTPSDADLRALRALSDAATPGPWAWNSYSRIDSVPMSEKYNEAEALIPDDATDDDPRWAALPETSVCYVNSIEHGDLATKQGDADARFIEAAINYVRTLIAATEGSEHDH